MSVKLSQTVIPVVTVRRPSDEHSSDLKDRYWFPRKCIIHKKQRPVVMRVSVERNTCNTTSNIGTGGKEICVVRVAPDMQCTPTKSEVLGKV